MQRRTKDGKYDLVSEGYKEIRQTGRPWPLPPPYHFHGFPDEAVAYYQNTAFVSDLALRLQELMRSIFHVGPLREYPDRTYLWSGEQHQHVGQRGERAIEAILAARDRRFNWKPKQRLKRLDELVVICKKLQEENASLRNRQDLLTAERATLLQKNEQVRGRVEAMISRLKAMEQTS